MLVAATAPAYTAPLIATPNAPLLMGIMAFIAILFAIPNDDKRVKDAK
jgi:hypothetical protein